MNQKLTVAALFIFIAVLVVFISTFSWFMLFKERVCKLNLNSPACTETYPVFVQHELGR